MFYFPLFIFFCLIILFHKLFFDHQIVTLTHTLLTHRKLTKVERVLVVCPLSTVHNWVNEFTMWLKFATCKKEIDIYEISKSVSFNRFYND